MNKSTTNETALCLCSEMSTNLFHYSKTAWFSTYIAKCPIITLHPFYCTKSMGLVGDIRNSLLHVIFQTVHGCKQLNECQTV